MQRVRRAMVVMESLAARVKKFAFGLLRMLGWKRLRLRLMASHCRPLYLFFPSFSPRAAAPPAYVRALLYVRYLSKEPHLFYFHCPLSS